MKEIIAEEIPLTREVKLLVVVEMVLEVITEEVETTPLTEEVAMLPPIVKELELMMEVMAEEIPLTMVWKVLVVVERVLELMIPAEERLPATLE